jgi:hypothetical protein
MSNTQKIAGAAFFLLVPFLIHASDRSDAVDLMNACERSAKTTEIAVRNFGDKNDAAAFDACMGTIKQGKVKLAQSKFLDAKAKFQEYQKAEFDLYGSLAQKYMQRTQDMIDKIALEFADYVNQPEVLKNLNDASATLDSAKANYGTRTYMIVIQLCRQAKNQLLNCYGLIKKDIPNEYKKDYQDYKLQIFQG